MKTDVSVSQPALDSRTWRRNPKIEEAPLQGELMLFDPATSKFFVLNRTMAFVWQHCDGERSLSAIASDLTREFSDVDAGRAEADVRQALTELASLALVLSA